jgi:hypothetical protein
MQEGSQAPMRHVFSFCWLGIARSRALLAFLLLALNVGETQVAETIRTGNTCSYFGESIPENVTAFSSNREAESVIDRIVTASGLSRNFQIRAAGVPNAAAVIYGNARFILYNPLFIKEIRSSTGTEWAAISIMAHEVGHHLNGHTLTSGGSRPNLELEADYFSGFVLQKLGASMSDATVAMQKLGTSIATSTHPAKNDRLAAISSGWSKSCDGDSSCSGGTSPPSTKSPERKTTETKDTGGPDSCKYAKDGTCDEPDLCNRGTDTTDCRAQQSDTKSSRKSRPSRANSCEYANDGECDEPDTCDRGTDTNDCRRAQPQQVPVARVCATPFGSCAMAVAAPRGIGCVCPSPNGAINGITQ